MAIVYLALGSNMGDSKQLLTQAQTLLQPVLEAAVSAPLYTSKAVGYTDQPDFLNTVVGGDTTLAPDELLQFVKKIEQEIGRSKTFRWGPREIDIDVIFYDDIVMNTPDLTIPHPRFAERDFVLKPLCDLCNDFVDPVSEKPVSILLAAIPASERSISARKKV